MSSQVYTIVVEDKPIVSKVLSNRTIVDQIVVGTPSTEVNLAGASPNTETVVVGTGNHYVGEVVNNNTIVDEVIIGRPITTVIPAGQLNKEEILSVVDSAYVNSLVDGSPLIWEVGGADSEFRINVGWKEDNIIYTVREAIFNADGLLQLELAQFTPGISAAGQTNLNWDTPVTQWSVSVTNPDDFPEQYLAQVGPTLLSINGIIHPVVADYTTTGPNPVPAGTVDWSQTFTTNAGAKIYSNSSGLTGGSASAQVAFLDNNGTQLAETTPISFSWKTANVSISFGNLSGKNFLEYYTSVPYTITITGLGNPGANASSTISGVGGSLSSTTGSGTFTFTNPLHRNNNSGRTVSVSTDFTRPDTVTGSTYTVVDTASDTTISANFTYPSFYIFTSQASVPPLRNDVVTAFDFSAETTELGNQSKNIDTFITNPAAVPQAFWFGVRTSASQPTTFQTGASVALLSDVDVTTGYDVDLEPDAPLSGYSSVNYTLYGITLQPGQTYVRIS